jgi:hypothetical protein
MVLYKPSVLFFRDLEFENTLHIANLTVYGWHYTNHVAETFMKTRSLFVILLSLSCLHVGAATAV